MRGTWIQRTSGLALALVFLAGLATAAWAASAENSGESTLSIRLKSHIDDAKSETAAGVDGSDVGFVGDIDTATEKAPRESKPTATATAKSDASDKNASASPSPTPAVRPSAEAAPAPAAAAAPESAAAETAAAPLKPIPDASQMGPVEIEAASFKGVTPGQSTLAEVIAAWGAAKEMQKRDGLMIHLYSVEPFDRVELSYVDDKVASLVIRFDRAFPAEAVAQQLQLTDVRPVLVSNERGEVLGQVFPERGVLFAFEASAEEGKPSMMVNQIILEPISAEPFVLRAETNLDAQVANSLHDLEQALKIDPKNARALWLQSRLLAATGDYEKALAASAAAVASDPQNPHYHVARAQLLGQVGRIDDAMTEAKRAVETSDTRPHVGARALCLLGDLSASGGKPNYVEAIHYHSEAVKAADALVESEHVAIRVAAKEVLVDAHLGAAHDIAWGDWKDKEAAVQRWLSQAAAAAEEMIKTENTGEEIRFRVCTRALAACVGLRGGINPGPWANEALKTGDRLVSAARDPMHKTQLQWDLGMALYDALQAYQMRGDNKLALEYGQHAVEYIEAANHERASDSTAYLLGRLYFRLGALHAVSEKDHAAALAWFDKAIPLLEKPIPEEALGDLGRHGETFVSMGVSFWESGQRDKAVELTSHGVELMEQAAQKGLILESALAVPYGNLAAMHRQQGASDEADRFKRMAAHAKDATLK